MKKNIFYKNKEKGSFLFLAMVIISVVLASGIGASTILVRQLRKMNETEKAAVAFYVAETGLDRALNDVAFIKGEWVDIDIEEADRDSSYMVEDEGEEEYKVTVKVDNDYYVFNKTGEEGGGGGGNMTVYYANLKNNWEKVYMRYSQYVNSTYVRNTVPMLSFSNNWYKYEINKEDIISDELIILFGNSESNLPDGPYYIDEKNGSFPNCISFPPNVFSFCENEDEDLSIYYNGTGAENVLIRYRFYYKGRPNPIVFEEPMIVSNYTNWWKYVINNDVIGPNDQIRIIFTVKNNGVWTVGSVYYFYKDSTSSNCFLISPNDSCLFLED
jgi:hypothetical protein